MARQKASRTPWKSTPSRLSMETMPQHNQAICKISFCMRLPYPGSDIESRRTEPENHGKKRWKHLGPECVQSARISMRIWMWKVCAVQCPSDCNSWLILKGIGFPIRWYQASETYKQIKSDRIRSTKKDPVMQTKTCSNDARQASRMLSRTRRFTTSALEAPLRFFCHEHAEAP